MCRMKKNPIKKPGKPKKTKEEKKKNRPKLNLIKFPNQNETKPNKFKVIQYHSLNKKKINKSYHLIIFLPLPINNFSKLLK